MIWQPLVFDQTAIALLFECDERVYRYWREADWGRLTIVLPALAIVEAGRQLKVDASAWEAVLEPEHVQVVPLDETPAKDIGAYSGELAACHVLWEAEHVDGIIVTRMPELYGRGVVPLLVV